MADQQLAPIKECINNAWTKLDQYYGRLDDSPVYATAIWLHPSDGWLYVDGKGTGKTSCVLSESHWPPTDDGILWLHLQSSGFADIIKPTLAHVPPEKPSKSRNMSWIAENLPINGCLEAAR
jgi:hypothetical protein